MSQNQTNHSNESIIITHWHGMTETAFVKWQNGFDKSTQASPWTVSNNDGYTYLHSVEKYIENEGMDSADDVICRAYRSALIQGCFTLDKYVYVVGFDFSNKEFEQYLCHDYSCENMDHIADCIPERFFNSQYIKRIIKVKVNPFIYPFIANGLQENNDMFNYDDLSEDIINILSGINTDMVDPDVLWSMGETTEYA